LDLIFLIESFSDGSDLPMFELGDLDRAPSLGGATPIFLAASATLMDSFSTRSVP